MKWLRIMAACAAVASLVAARSATGAEAETPATANHDQDLPAQPSRPALAILSSPPHYVSGGDARIEVRAPAALHTRLGLWLNGRRIEPALRGVRRPHGRRRRRHDPRRQPARTAARFRPGAARFDEADQLPHHRADVLGPAADAVRLQDEPAASAAPRRQRVAARICGVRRAGQDRRLQPQLLARALRHLLVPHDRRCLERAAGRHGAARRHAQRDAAGPHGRLRRAPGARHDQPLHLQLRDARASRRRSGPARPEPVEPAGCSTGSTAASGSATRKAGWTTAR